jgi:hypothetical protein
MLVFVLEMVTHDAWMNLSVVSCARYEKRFNLPPQSIAPLAPTYQVVQVNASFVANLRLQTITTL